MVGSTPDLDALRIDELASGQAWSIIAWEAAHLPGGVQLATAEALRPVSAADADATIAAYLRGQGGPPEADGGTLELAIGTAISARLRADGVTGLGDGAFPPVIFTFDQPPRVLIVSPRTQIRVAYSELLVSDISLEQQEALEQAVERLGWSAL